MSDKSWGELWNASPLEVLRCLSSGKHLQQASWHPLGFVHAELARNRYFAYRFHIWPPGERRPKTPNWQIHNHVFSLISRVLVGSIENRLYDVVDAPKGVAAKQLYEVAYGNGASELRPTGRFVDVVTSSVQTHSAPMVYEVPCGVFHESFVGHLDVVATMVRTDFMESASPLVVGDVDQRVGRPYEYQYQRTLVDQTDLMSWLYLALGELENGP